ncbi:MAG TPA: SRPBCC family protein [Acidimicrobiales bacterium]|nr:SRPBCC family protein [Acidimicrobiales bacterium]
MRYRDQPTVEVSERIVAEPAAIWALLTDITFPVEISPELQRVEWLDDADRVAVGNRFQGTNRNEHLGEWTTTAEVVEVEPERRWVYQVRNGDDVMASWGFEIDPGRDAVTVRQWARLGPDPSGLSIAIGQMPEKEARILARRIEEWRAAMTANLAAIRAAVESD